MKSKIVILSKSDKSLKFKVSNIKSNIFLRVFLVLLVLFCIVFPLSILFIDELDIGFGYIITLAIFLGTALFFGRMYLWTYHGGEVFDISNDTFSHYFDYHFFIDNSINHTFNTLTIGYSSIDNPNEIIQGIPNMLPEKEEVYLGVILDGHPIKSHLTVTCGDIKELSGLV